MTPGDYFDVYHQTRLRQDDITGALRHRRRIETQFCSLITVYFRNGCKCAIVRSRRTQNGLSVFFKIRRFYINLEASPNRFCHHFKTNVTFQR